MLLQMSKVQIIGMRDHLEVTLQTLHRLGVVQIEDVTQDSAVRGVPRLTLDATTLAQRDELGMLVTRLESLLAFLPAHLPPTPGHWSDEALATSTEGLVAEAKKLLDDLSPRAQDLAVQRDALEAERTVLPRYAAAVRYVVPLAAELPELDAYETVALLIERRFSAVLERLHQELSASLGEQFELKARDIDAQTTAAILVFPKAQNTRVQALLGHESISQVRLPQALSQVSFREALTTIAARLEAIPGQLAAIRRQLQELATQWYGRLVLLRTALRDRLQELEVAPRLGATQYTFVLVGWMPRRHLDEVRGALAQQVGPQVVLNALAVRWEEMAQAPVLLSNPAPVRPFEFLVQLLPLPRYGTLDPTPFMALFMPMFFGLILGDVAYGALVLGLAVYVQRRFPSGAWHSLAQVLLVCGLWAVLFGFLFGELLGRVGHDIFALQPLWMQRSGAALPVLLLFSIVLGAVHVGLGLLLGIWQAWQQRNGKAGSARLGKLAALVALFWLVGVLSNTLPAALFTPGIVLLIISMVLLGTPLGWAGIVLGPLEVLGVLGNVLSYLRLGAIGLSSVYLAEVAYQLHGVLGGALVGGIVAGLFHALNLALGIASPTIQALRLHYVEFFPTFHEGGGEGFKPFKSHGM